MFGARRPRSPGASHAALGTGCPVTPRSTLPTEAGRCRAQRLPDGCPEMVPKVPHPLRPRPQRALHIRARTGARPPRPRHPPRPKPGRVRRPLRSNGCPIAAATSPPQPKPWRSRDSCARTGARLPPSRRPRGRNRGGPATVALGRVPDSRRCFTPRGRNHEEIGDNCIRTGCPIAAATSPPRPKPWRSRDSCARTGAQVPMALHPTQPKLDGDPCRRRSDGCPCAEGALPWAAEAARGAARPRPNRCPFADAASPSATEAAERGATSTPGRVPSCRR
jgi:hypothetical protein